MESQDTNTVQHKIEVVVFSPRSPHPKTFRWPPSQTVGTAADEAAREFGYAPGDTPPTFQNAENRVLDRAKTLHDEGVKNGDKLEIVAGGGGV
jgi:hypothetical protein